MDFITYAKTKPQEQRSVVSGALLPQKMLEIIHDIEGVYPLHKLIEKKSVSTKNHKAAWTKTDPALNWVSEGSTIPETVAEFAGAVFNLHKLSVTLKMSEELLMDSEFDLEQYLGDAFGRALGENLESAFINGDGTDKPLGFLQSCDTIPSAAANIGYSDIQGLYSRLSMKYAHRAAWLVNNKTLSAIARLSDNGCPLFQSTVPKELGNAIGNVLGAPVYLADMPDSKPVAFGDFTQYVCLEGTPSIQRLDEPYSETGLIAFVYRQAIDAKLLRSDAVLALEM